MLHLLPPRVEGSPFRAPVEGYAALSLVEIVQFLDCLMLDSAGAFDIEQAEGDLVLCVWFREEVLECSPIVQIDPPSSPPVRNPEQDPVLLAFYLVLNIEEEMVSPLFCVFVSFTLLFRR